MIKIDSKITKCLHWWLFNWVSNRREHNAKVSSCYDEVTWEELSGELVRERNEDS